MSHGAILRAIDEGRTEKVMLGLKSEDPGTRAFAAGGLARLGATEAAGALADLVYDSNWIVRASASAAAGELKTHHKRLEEALLQALDDSEIVVVRLATQALGKLKSETSVPRLTEIMLDESTDLSGEAIVALGSIADKRAAIPLIDQLGGPHMSAAIVALGKIGEKAAFGPLVDKFTERVSGFDEWYIVAALRDIGARDTVFEMMKLHPVPETRRMLGRVAGEWWPDEAAVRSLVTAMLDESATVRAGAAFRLSDYDLPESLKGEVKSSLKSGLQDSDADVRHWCAKTLKEWGGK